MIYGLNWIAIRWFRGLGHFWCDHWPCLVKYAYRQPCDSVTHAQL